jgi:hypothetical protein
LTQNIKISGDTSVLPEFTPLPSPTAAPYFEVSFKKFDKCEGKDYANFIVVNAGSAPFRSVYIRVTDLKVNKSVDHALNAFDQRVGSPEVDECDRDGPVLGSPSTREHMGAHSTGGQRAVEGGTFNERMAALYKDPPVSQEQILHQDRWFGPKRDYPQAIVWAADLATTDWVAGGVSRGSARFLTTTRSPSPRMLPMDRL